MNKRFNCLLTLLILSLWCGSADAQDEWVRKVLAENDPAKKEQIACMSARSASTQALAAFAKRERHGPVVAAVAGQYFEKGNFDQNTPDLLRLLAKREDIAAQVLAYAALSPGAPDLIKGFAALDEDADQQIAARLIAAIAAMRRGEAEARKVLKEKDAEEKDDKKEKNNKKKKPGGAGLLKADYSAELEQLLNNSKDETALECALLAAGYERAEQLKEAISKHKDHREPAVAMAAQFALASIGAEVDAQAILKQIERRPLRQKPRPALSYDPRHTERIYAILAAGEAGLTEAVEPLFKLVNDDDLHTAVAATRALGGIGGEAVVLRLLGMMTDDTLWPVRVAMYDAAGADPHKAAIEPLLERFRAEPGRFRQDALYALLSIVAGQPEGMSGDAFHFWWSQNSESFKVDAQATAVWRAEHRVGEAEVRELAGFYESAVISDRPVFVVDASKSMQGAQIESLKQTLDDVVISFPVQVKFNIVDFGGHVRALAPGGMIPARNSETAMHQFKYEMELTLGTRSYDAIERAMQIPGMDTVHFLSDGAPVGGDQNHWQRIDYAFRLYCMDAPVAIHVIYFPEGGKAGKPANAKLAGKVQLMADLAMNHAGRFNVSSVAPLPKK